MNRKYCLFITPFFSPNMGGAETHFNDLLKEAENNKISYIISSYKPLLNKQIPYKLKTAHHVIFRFPWYSQEIYRYLEKYPFLEWFYLFPILFIQSFIILFMYRKKISVIHSQGFIGSTIGFLFQMFRKKMIMSNHTVYFFNKNSLTVKVFTLIANNHHIVLAVSKLAKKELISWGVKPHLIKPFRYWVNTKIFKPIAKSRARKLLKLPRNFFYVLNISRLDRAKGLDILIETAELIYRKNRNIIFLIISGAKNRKHFCDFIGRKSLPGNCRYIGQVNNTKVNIWYNSANLLIITSRREGYPRVSIESMLCATPVISGKVGSLAEVLNDKIAFFVDKISPKNFTERLLQIHNKPFQLKKTGMDAFLYARKKFSEKDSQLIFKWYYD